jgi:hypothetical protein
MNQTPLRDVLYLQNWEEARRLIAEGKYIDEEIWDPIHSRPNSLLHYAIWSSAPLDILESLLLAGVHPNDGYTLYYTSNLQEMEMLLEYGVDPNIKTHGEESVLYGKLCSIRFPGKNTWRQETLLLLRYGANPDLPIYSYITPCGRTTMRKYVRQVCMNETYPINVRRCYQCVDDIFTGVKIMEMLMYWFPVSKRLPKELWRMLRYFLYVSQV